MFKVQSSDSNLYVLFPWIGSEHLHRTPGVLPIFKGVPVNLPRKTNRRSVRHGSRNGLAWPSTHRMAWQPETSGLSQRHPFLDLHADHLSRETSDHPMAGLDWRPPPHKFGCVKNQNSSPPKTLNIWLVWKIFLFVNWDEDRNPIN